MDQHDRDQLEGIISRGVSRGMWRFAIQAFLVFFVVPFIVVAVLAFLNGWFGI